MADVLVGETLRVGDVTLTPVLDGYGRVPPDQFFGVPDGVDAAAVWSLADHARWLDHDGMLTMPISCFVVRARGRTALIDAGAGTFTIPGFSGGLLPESLAAAGVAVDDIDTLVLSHLHFDHVGWAATKGADGVRRPTFPRATIRCGAEDWRHFVDDGHAPGGVRHGALLPVADRVEPCADGDEVFPGVTALGAPGHTPGHHAYVVADAGERAVILGDALHCPIQLEHREWEVMGDVDRELAVRTRTALLRELDGDTQVGAPHFPGLRFGRVVTGATGRTWG